MGLPPATPNFCSMCISELTRWAGVRFGLLPRAMHCPSRPSTGKGRCDSRSRRRQLEAGDARARGPADDAHGVVARTQVQGGCQLFGGPGSQRPILEGCSARSRMLLSSTRTVKPPARWGHQQTALSRYAPSAGISMRQVALAAGETKSRAPVMLSLSGLACCDAATPTYLPCPAEESSPRVRVGVMDAAASASIRTVSAAAAGGGVLARPNSPLVYSNHACRPWTSYVDPARSGFVWRAMRMSASTSGK